MKTAKEWAEYLPLDIKLWFIEECERQKCLFETRYFSLRDAIHVSLNYDLTELGAHFWFGVWSLACDYQGREAEILTDLEWIDDGKVAPKKRKKSKENKIELAVMFFNENQELEKENAEFKKRHKFLLKANQESMERRVELGDANMKLLSENTELKEKHSQIIQGLATENNNLKARCEALTLEVSQLEKDLGVANATVYLQKETRDDLMKQIKGLKEIIADLEAGEGKQSIWSKIKNLCN
jgi:hypothetical protein